MELVAGTNDEKGGLSGTSKAGHEPSCSQV